MGNQVQREMTARVPLLGKKGELLHPGYARHMLYDYDRSLAADWPFRLKGWGFADDDGTCVLLHAAFRAFIFFKGRRAL